MRQIFKEITARLMAIESMNWADKDKGQMNFERPPILFPAGLVTISTPRRQNIVSTQQSVQAQIRIKLCFDWGGNTSGITPQQHLDKSLAYYDVVDEVWESFQGWSTDEIGPLECINFNPLARPDTYTTEELIFVGEFIERVGP